MAIDTYNFPPIKKGATFKDTNFWVGTGEGVNFVPTDITDYTFCFQLREYSGARVVHSFDLQIVSAVGGQVLIPKWQVDIARGVYYYDIKYTMPNGDTGYYLEGTFTVLENISECQ